MIDFVTDEMVGAWDKKGQVRITVAPDFENKELTEISFYDQRKKESWGFSVPNIQAALVAEAINQYFVGGNAVASATPEPDPVKTEDSEIVLDGLLSFIRAKGPKYNTLVGDFIARQRLGKRKYNTVLNTFNGRNALNDALQEALDQCIYLKQEIMERKALARKKKAQA